MTGIFDGMAGVLNGVFGAPVAHLPVVGAPVTMRGIFREQPIEVADEDGRAILIIAPTLRVRKADAATIATRDEIEPGNGKTYTVENRHPSGSPANDAFVIFELEEVAS